MTDPLLSACHLAPVTVGGDDLEGTHYHICSVCHEACDIAVSDHKLTLSDIVSPNMSPEADAAVQRAMEEAARVQEAVTARGEGELRPRIDEIVARFGIGAAFHGINADNPLPASPTDELEQLFRTTHIELLYKLKGNQGHYYKHITGMDGHYQSEMAIPVAVLSAAIEKLEGK